ncbi:AAA family ATPase [Micromonospora okii]|uniref:AAA family ATPase n=1 Tax=Micromonospora okii TaxID=1182970 RepID=UPI001E3A6E75|nr:AAA family ATPase [Micromonospora okii]
MPTDPRAAHTAAIDQVWRLLDAGAQAVIVNSPPGAGKSTLVRATARRMAGSHGQIPIITQTNEQADDLTRDLLEDLRDSPIRAGRLHADKYTPPVGVTASTDIDELNECDIVVAPAAKWGFVRADHRWELGIVDEAYQVSSVDLAKFAARFDALLLVGDPGQLSPFTTADEGAIRSTGSWPLETAAGTVLGTYPDTPVVPLPVSWRLPPSGAGIVSDAFYSRAFTAGSDHGERGLRLPLGAIRDSVDEVLRVAERYGWCLAQLPDAQLPRTDPQAVATIANIAHRLLSSKARIQDGKELRNLYPRDIAIGVTHRDQQALVRAAADTVCESLDLAPGSIVVDTANKLQGRQFEVVIAWHPLSGRRDASAFHLEAGRLCVLASRHRQACIVVTRDGVRQQLDAYPHTEPVWIGAATPEVDGWEANHRFLDGLNQFAVSVDA